MDSASQSLLLSRAHKGQPLAIATLIHRRLNSDEIDVTAWKKQGLLYIDLMSFERLVKADLLPAIRQTLAELSPDGIRGVKVSSYIYGEDLPCWMERLSTTVALATLHKAGSVAAAGSLTQRLEAQVRNLIGNRRLAVGASVLVLLATGALGFSLQLNSLGNSLADQPEGDRPVRARNSQQLIESSIEP